MDRREIVNIFAEVRGDAVVITGPGISSGMLFEAHAHPATIYNMDLAYSGPMAMGIALGAPQRRVVSLEGDGSRYAAAASLGTYVRYPLPNLVLTLANGIWERATAVWRPTSRRISGTRWPSPTAESGVK